MQERFKEEGLHVIVLGFQDTRENLVRYAKELNVPKLTFAFDIDSDAAKLYDIKYTAAVVFIDKKGIVSRRLSGGFNEPELLRNTYRIIK